MEKKKYRKPIDLILFFVLGIGVGIAFGMSSVLLLRYNKKDIKKEYKYETVELTNCDKEAKLYYQEKDRKVYLYCLNSIKVKEGNNSLELKNYYQNHSNILEEIMSEMEISNQYDDGGTTIYRDDAKITSNGFAILKCSTLFGNNDIYIGPKNMQFEKSFCKSGNPIDITKIYTVLNIEPSNDENYIYITVREFQREVVSTVRISSVYSSILLEDKNYEFEFSFDGDVIEDNPSVIFEQAELLSIQETDKLVLEQNQ